MASARVVRNAGAFLLFAFLLLLGRAARAQDAPQKPARDFSFIVMPIPVLNPAIGNGLAVGAVGLYRVGDSRRPWATLVGGLKTNTGSKAALVAQKAYLNHDKTRVTAALGAGDFHVDFFGIGSAAGHRGESIPINQRAQGALVEGLYRVAPHLFAGLEYRFINMRTAVDIANPPFPDQRIPEFELRSRTSQLGVAAEYDTRDREYQPRKGLYLKGFWLWAASDLGGDFNYHRAEFIANGYQPLGRGVFAWRGFLCSAGGNAPFYDICNFGSHNDLRGYTGGQYRDHAMFAVQGEYRRHLFWRIGGVAFVGVGEVAPRFGDITSSNLLPAGGLGVRYEASTKYRVNVGIDYAWGKDSQAAYFRIGEAF